MTLERNTLGYTGGAKDYPMRKQEKKQLLIAYTRSAGWNQEHDEKRTTAKRRGLRPHSNGDSNLIIATAGLPWRSNGSW